MEETYNYESPSNYYHNTSNQSQGCRPYTGQSGNRQFRGFVPRNRGQRPQYSQHQFQNYHYQRSALQQNRTQYGSACKPYFQGNQVNTYQGRGWGGVLSNSEDMPTAGRISRIPLARININTMHMTSNRNSMAHHVVCVEDLIIPPSIVIKGNTILITLWKR